MLEVRGLSVSYGKHRALDDVGLKVGKGEIVVILGANGAGKSTLLRAIGGNCEGAAQGSVVMDSEEILGQHSDAIVETGIALVPEGRGVFADLSVRENLLLGAYPKRARDSEQQNLDRVFDLFPKLVERKRQIVRTMSGGEQQMVAIGRAMMSAPTILMLDEPSLGLSPILCKELFQNLSHVRAAGLGILLVEQNAKQSLAIADRGYLLENARVMHEDSAENLAKDPAVQKAYLGAGAASVPMPAKPAAAAVTRNDVAAEALRGVSEIPAAFHVSKRPAATRSADEMIGQSVSDMVARASVREESTVKISNAPDTKAHGDRLQVMLREMEVAAAKARSRGRK